MTSTKIRITVNSKTFTATLVDNPTATAFKAMLPLTMAMTEFNDNEKFCDLKKKLPSNPTYPKTIKNGDLMLYGSETLVLFYKTFPTTYSYTKIGEVTDPAGLVAALGPKDVEVRFELE